MQSWIDNEDPRANNKLIDLNKITAIIYLRFSLVTFRLFLMILSSAYYLGVLWLIFVELEFDVDPDSRTVNGSWYFYR